MTLCSAATLQPSPAPDATLALLARAMGRCLVEADRRVLASNDSYSPDEGLALLDAYVAVADAGVRQAILDVLITIAETQPYRSVRALHMA